MKASTRTLGRSLLALVSIVALPLCASAQERAEDRRRFIDAETAVSLDPRRVPVPPESVAGPEGSIAIVGARVFDGTGSPSRAATIVIERNRIAAILEPGSPVPEGARVIEAPGHTVLPGLIDLHTHLTYTDAGVSPAHAVDEADATLRAVERLRYYIESGVTSVRDVASHLDVPFRLKEWVAERRLPGPRVFPAGKLITGTSGHGAEGLDPTSALYGAVREASGADDWREAVRENFKAGADVIKIASHFGRDEVEAAVEEAHALGMKVTCDCETFYVQWAVEAGVDMIEHPLPRTDETILAMAERGVAADPTLVPYVYIFDVAGGYWGSTSRRFSFSKSDNVDMLRRLREAGVKVGVGTDLVFDWFRYMPSAYITELEGFVDAGYTIREALMIATKQSAELLDMGDRLGTLAPGMLADVLIVDGDPESELRDLRNVAWVIRDGEVVVQEGRVYIPPHEPLPEPGEGGSGQWNPGGNP